MLILANNFSYCSKWLFCADSVGGLLALTSNQL